jgi:hypothetical protein
VGGVVVERAPQGADVDNSFVDVGVVVPDGGEQLPAGQDQSRVARQGQEQVVVERGHGDASAAGVHAAAAGVDRDAGEGERGLRRLAVAGGQR